MNSYACENEKKDFYRKGIGLSSLVLLLLASPRLWQYLPDSFHDGRLREFYVNVPSGVGLPTVEPLMIVYAIVMGVAMPILMLLFVLTFAALYMEATAKTHRGCQVEREAFFLKRLGMLLIFPGVLGVVLFAIESWRQPLISESSSAFFGGVGLGCITLAFWTLWRSFQLYRGTTNRHLHQQIKALNRVEKTIFLLGGVIVLAIVLQVRIVNEAFQEEPTGLLRSIRSAQFGFSLVVGLALALVCLVTPLWGWPHKNDDRWVDIVEVLLVGFSGFFLPIFVLADVVLVVWKGGLVEGLVGFVLAGATTLFCILYFRGRRIHGENEMLRARVGDWLRFQPEMSIQAKPKKVRAESPKKTQPTTNVRPVVLTTSRLSRFLRSMGRAVWRLSSATPFLLRRVALKIGQFLRSFGIVSKRAILAILLLIRKVASKLGQVVVSHKEDLILAALGLFVSVINLVRPRGFTSFRKHRARSDHFRPFLMRGQWHYFYPPLGMGGPFPNRMTAVRHAYFARKDLRKAAAEHDFRTGATYRVIAILMSVIGIAFVALDLVFLTSLELRHYYRKPYYPEMGALVILAIASFAFALYYERLAEKQFVKTEGPIFKTVLGKPRHIFRFREAMKIHDRESGAYHRIIGLVLFWVAIPLLCGIGLAWWIAIMGSLGPPSLKVSLLLILATLIAG